MTTLDLKITDSLEIKADKLEIYIQVESDDENYSTARDNGAAKSATVLSVLEQLGLDRKELSVINIGVAPIYKAVEEVSGTKRNHRVEKTREICGYKYRATVCVELTAGSSLAGKIYTRLLGDTELVSSINYRYFWTDLSQYEDELTENIIKKALHKAEVIAKGFGRKVDGIKSISNHENTYDSTPYRGYAKAICNSAMSMEDTVQYMFTEESIETKQMSDSLTICFNLVKE